MCLFNARNFLIRPATQIGLFTPIHSWRQDFFDLFQHKNFSLHSINGPAYEKKFQKEILKKLMPQIKVERVRAHKNL